MKTNFKEQLKDERPYWKVIVSLTFSLVSTILFIYLGFRLLIFFMPFVVGWFIAYIAAPVVNWLEKKIRLVKKLGSALIIIGVLTAVVFLIYLAGSRLWREAAVLMQDLPEMYEELEKGLGQIGDSTKGIFERLPAGVQNGWHMFTSNLDETIGEIMGKISEPTVTAAGNFAKKIPSVLIATIVTFISAYFFIAERDEVILWSKKVMPDAIVKRMTMVVDNLKYAVGGYFKAQMKIMVVVFLLLFIGFLILGIHFIFLLALLIAFLDFLPFFGTGTALIPWAAYKFMTGDYKMAAGLIILYGITQLVRQLIQPKLVGDSMGMKPLVTLVFLYVGYRVGGVFGMIFAVPVGLIAINLYKAGAFDYILVDMKILLEGVLSLRNQNE
ncbi:MAG: sporulation integral membrane protein YtvI [Lachnospiraceae bacterium]